MLSQIQWDNMQKNSDYFMLSHTITHRQLRPTVNFRYHTLPADPPPIEAQQAGGF